MTRTKLFIFLFVTIVLLGATTVTKQFVYASGGHHKHGHHTTTTTVPSPLSREFSQLPSNSSDFNNGDTNTVKLVSVHGGNSVIGGWLLRGIVQNIGNKTIPMVTITATIYDSTMQPVDTMQQPAIIGSDTTLAPGQQKPFELYGEATLGAYFKLGYTW